jgi:RNA polymerase sigma factor (sigma-70 family)
VHDHGSVTRWLTQLAAGDTAAAGPLWERYYGRMVGLARARLGRTPLRAADEEDVALSAFHQFCRAASDGRFARLANRDDLWQLLVVLTARKAVDLYKHQARQKRTGEVSGLDADVPGPDEDPALEAAFADELRSLFDRLPPEVRAVAELRLDGLEKDEIAARLGCTVRTVDRRLVLVRSYWEDATLSAERN